MSIPSIGGNSDGLSKIQIKSTIQQTDLAESVSQIQQDVIQSEFEKEAPAQNAQVQETSQSSVSESAVSENEDEYSIKKFKQDYSRLVEKEVIPVMSKFEDERKKRLVAAVISASVLGLVAFILFFFVNPESTSANKAVGQLAWGSVLGAFLVWTYIKKSFENKIKKLIMPVLMSAIPGFDWLQTPPVKKEDIQNCMIIPFSKKVSYSFDDCFVGKYRNVNVALSECKCDLGNHNNKKTIIEGAFIKFDMNKNFEGVTVIRPRDPGYRDKYDDLKREKMSEVELEDPEFSKKFVVYSTDQIEARYLITTAFMERFKQVEDAFDADFSYCSFSGKSIYIAPHTGRDMFNLCSLVKPIVNREQFETLFNEFASILAMVDHFKLDKKLGL